MRRRYVNGRLVTDSLQFQGELGSVCSRAEKERTLPAQRRCSQMEVCVTEAHGVCVLLQGFADMSGSALAWGTETGVQWISMQWRSARVLADNISAPFKWQLLILDVARTPTALSNTGTISVHIRHATYYDKLAWSFWKSINLSIIFSTNRLVGFFFFFKANFYFRYVYFFSFWRLWKRY